MKKIILSIILLLIISFSDSYGQSVNFTESILPILKVNTNGKFIMDEPKILADFQNKVVEIRIEKLIKKRGNLA